MPFVEESRKKQGIRINHCKKQINSALKLSKTIDIDYYTMKYDIFNCKAFKSDAEIITQYT
jgi:hypothetical protein